MNPLPRLHWFRLVSLSALLIAFWVLFGAGAAGAAGQGPPNPPAGPKSGQEAIDALGARLPEVAAAYGLSPAQLSELLLADHTLHVDKGGELLYLDDPFLGDRASSLVGKEGSAAAPFPTEQTFLLHSLTGANHTIYLDFDGHTTVGTTWNSSYGVPTIISPPYDIDGNTASFSATEIERIQLTWQIVAEDFRPFNVNVTTQDPGPAALSYQGGGDSQWGTRVVITNDTFANCGCGGHAYIGSFDDPQDEPVFVYNTSLTGVSEASSHEVGHALNLSHDGSSAGAYYYGHGSGATSWGPIMGAAYNKSVTQWSKGEYYDANNAGPSANYGYGPDDLAIIASLTNGNGFGYKADDHGGSSQAATPLSVAAGAVSGAGAVERTTDIDVFSFTTGAGQVSLNILPAGPNYNLDVLAELRDAGGVLVATSNPASVLTAAINTSLAQGTYYLYVDGAGTGAPLDPTPTGYTEYGSLGQYAISGTIVETNNNPPAFNSDPIIEAAAAEDDAYSSSLADDASDPDGDTLTFSKVSGPAWLVVASSGALSGTPANGDVGPNDWTVEVSDGNGGTDQATLQIAVLNTNDAPAFNSDPLVKANATADAAYNDSLAGDASDPDGDPLTYAKVNGPTWLTIAGDGALSGTPGTGDLGLNNWTVQVSDGYGGVDQATLQITVDEPVLFVDFVASSEIYAGGSVSGSYLDTQADGGPAEAITEIESGGKPANRHSYLDHKWLFTVQPGTSMILFANAWAAASADGDSFILSYSTDDITYTTLGALTAAVDDGSYQPFVLPNDLSGTIYIRLLDSDRAAGHRALDTVYVDHLFIRSDSQLPDPPAAPSNLAAAAAGASQIDLTWSDNSSNELGFRIERSPDGQNGWTLIAEVGAGVTGYSDTGLTPGTTYYYRAAAYNAAGSSTYTNTASDTTGTAGAMHVSDMTGSGLPGSRGRWDATVTITVVDQNGAPVSEATVSGNWSGGASGGSSCITAANGQCAVARSNIKNSVTSVTFTVTAVQHAANTYDPDSNVITSVVVNIPS